MDLTNAFSAAAESAADAMLNRNELSQTTLDPFATAAGGAPLRWLATTTDGTDAPSAALNGGSGPKPVFQLMAFPLVIDPKTYANPASGSNPDGDYRSLFAFRSLVDPIPNFSRLYTPTSGGSTERAWGALITGASVGDGQAFASQILADAQAEFASYALANLGGVRDPWRPVYATPPDWYDFNIPGRFKTMEIDLSVSTSGGGTYATIGDDANATELTWLIADGDGPPQAVALDPDTTLKAITFKGLMVLLSRPWLNVAVFKTGGYSLAGQTAGYYSSGNLAANEGVLPLLPTAFCLADGVSVQAAWGPKDAEILQAAARNDLRVSLGHFALSSGRAPAAQGLRSGFAATLAGDSVSSSVVQIVGWVSALVPLCPQLQK